MTKKLSALIANPLGVAQSGLSYFGANIATANGWVGNGTFSAPTTTVVTSELPLAGIYATAIKFTSPTTAGTEGTNDWSYTFTTPKSGGVKTPIDIYMVPGANFIANEWTISVFQGATKQVIDQQDTNGFLYLPVVTGKTGNISFQPLSNTTYTLRACRRVNAGANVGVLTAVIDLGLGQRFPAAAPGDPLNFNLAAQLTNEGTLTDVVANYARLGPSMRVSFTATMSTDPAGIVMFGLPGGVNIDTTKYSANSAVDHVLGTFRAFDTSASTPFVGAVVYRPGTGIVFAGSNGAVSTGTPFVWAAGDDFSADFSVYVAEWAGTAINFGQNDFEYLSDDGTADVISANGSLVPNQAFNSGSVTRDFSFSFPNQLLNGFSLEISEATGRPFVPASLYPFAQGNNGTSNNTYGMRAYFISATVMRVEFGNQGTKIDSSAVSAGTTAWSTMFSAGARFRVVKSAYGTGVPFGPLTGTSSGLFPSSNGNLDDIAATRLGLKQYLHGTAYNGGLSPTITLASGGGTLTSITRGVFIPYQSQDGSWRVKFNVAAVVSSATRTSAEFAVAGLVAKNLGGLAQAFSANDTNTNMFGYTSANSGSLTCKHASATTAFYSLSGEMDLESKPTWAY